MNVELVLSQLDSLIENRRTDLVEGYLREKMEEAAEEGDRRAVITLMNELISYYGGTGELKRWWNTVSRFSCFCREWE